MVRIEIIRRVIVITIANKQSYAIGVFVVYQAFQLASTFITGDTEAAPKSPTAHTANRLTLFFRKDNILYNFNFNPMNYSLSSIKILFIFLTVLLFNACSKDNESYNPDYFLNVSFSQDTIPSIHGYPDYNMFYYALVNSESDSFSYYNIMIAKEMIYQTNDFEGWGLSITIPKAMQVRDSIYQLFEFDKFSNDSYHKNYISFERFYNYYLHSHYTDQFESSNTSNQNGYFELFNVTDSTIGIKITDLVLTDWKKEVTATLSCKFTLRNIKLESN